MIDIDLDALTRKIYSEYNNYSIVAAQNIAKDILQNTHPSLEPTVKAWVDGYPLPTDENEAYSVQRIMNIRQNQDYIEAFRLLTRYKENPEIGEALIWKPSRSLHVKGF